MGQWQVAFGSPQLWLELVAANPQLADPDVIKPGDELNVPASLVKLFRIIAEVDRTGDPQPVKTVPVIPFVVSKEKSSGLPVGWIFGIVFLLAAVIILIIMLAIVRRGEKRAEDDLERERSRRENEREVHKATEQRRERENPYSGPAVVEGGLPTIESAVKHFTEQYRDERRGMTVGESEKLPAVAIERIVPVDVRGKMRVEFKDKPAFKDLPKWTPAWQCFLSDGTFRITLMLCGNDVRRGEGYSPLPETQIRPRQDGTPSFTPETPRQVWPVVTETPAPESSKPESAVTEPAAKSDDIPKFVRATITDIGRIVLRKLGGGDDVIVDVRPIPGVYLCVDDVQIIFRTGDKKTVFGILVEGPAEEKPGDC
ncbi:MAG: hypothetical protein ABIH38_03435 [Patescibacteria group bacterium]